MTTDMLLSKVFDEMRNGVRQSISAGEYDRLKEEFVFHMTDWRDDLDRLQLLFQDPNRDPGDAAREVAGFLYHALPHMNAASRLLLDGVADPFAVDAAAPRITSP